MSTSSNLHYGAEENAFKRRVPVRLGIFQLPLQERLDTYGKVPRDMLDQLDWPALLALLRKGTD